MAYKACSLAQPANITHLIELDFGQGGSKEPHAAEECSQCKVLWYHCKVFNNDSSVPRIFFLICFVFQPDQKFEKNCDTEKCYKIQKTGRAQL